MKYLCGHIISYPASPQENWESDFECPDCQNRKQEEVNDTLDRGYTAVQSLQNFAAEIDKSYEELMERTEHYLKTGEWWVEGNEFMNVETPPGFWEDYEKATRTKVPAAKQESFFSCSC